MIVLALNKVMLAALRAISRHDLNVRENYERTRKLFDASHPPIANPYAMWDRHVTVGDYDIPVRIFSPEQGLPENIIVFFHGGGWVTGGIESYTTACSRTANLCKSLVISVDYRLAPENPFPVGLEDCYAVAREVFRDSREFGLGENRVVLMGDSAGGNLAAAVSLLAHERGEFLPKKQILIYPCTYNDHSPDSPFASIRENGTDYLLTSKRICDYLALYLGDSDARNDPHFAPLLADDLSGQPATLLLTAELCPLRDEGEEYGRRLLEAGNTAYVHRIPDTIHGYFLLPTSFRAVRQSYELINEFLGEA